MISFWSSRLCKVKNIMIWNAWARLPIWRAGVHKARWSWILTISNLMESQPLVTKGAHANNSLGVQTTSPNRASPHSTASKEFLDQIWIRSWNGTSKWKWCQKVILKVWANISMWLKTKRMTPLSKKRNWMQTLSDTWEKEIVIRYWIRKLLIENQTPSMKCSLYS